MRVGAVSRPAEAVAGGAYSEEYFTPLGIAARVSVLIVNFNSRELLLRGLAALRRAAVIGGQQVVVVDNASHDGSAAAVRTQFPDAELVASPINEGYAAGNNRAFARSTAPLVLLLNPDAAVEPEAVERMAAYLEDHPEVAAVTANLVAADGSPRPYVNDFPDFLTLLLVTTPAGKLFRRAAERRANAYHMRDRLPATVAPVPQPPGACLMVRRAALNGPLFDERFPLFFNDVDLCRRLHQWGPIYFLPDARVIHERGEGGLKRAPETALLEGAVSAVRYFHKHHGPLTGAALYLGYAADFTARFVTSSVLRALGRPGARTPFGGTLKQNLARLARYWLGIGYFEPRAGRGSALRQHLMRVLHADLWSG